MSRRMDWGQQYRPVGETPPVGAVGVSPLPEHHDRGNIEMDSWPREEESGSNEHKDQAFVSSSQLHDDSGSDGRAIERPAQPRSRIGSYFIAVLCVASVAIVAVVAFLSMLWWADETNGTWHSIVVNDWFTRAITLATLVLRFAISMQAAIATSMLAAIVIEGKGIALADAATISVARFSNNGPHTFLWTLLHQPRNLLPTVLLLTLAVTTLVAQLSSFMLLSDLSTQPIPGTTQQNSTLYGFLYPTDNSSMLASRPQYFVLSLPVMWQPNYWAQGPTTFAAFAEYMEPPATNSLPDTVQDTGISIRSFLPLANQAEREVLREFNGETLTFDSRTVCVRPDFLSFQLENNTLTGIVRPFEGANVTGLVSNSSGVHFSCIPSPVDRGPNSMVSLDEIKDDRDVTWSLCRLPPSTGGLISMLDPTNNVSLRHEWTEGNDSWSYPRATWNAFDDASGNYWPVDLGNAYLILNYSSGAGYEFTNRSKQNWTLDGSGPWVDARIPYNTYAENYTIHIRSSLCFDALLLDSSYNHIQEFNVSIFSDVEQRSEPSLSWSKETNAFNTSELRHQYGVTNFPQAPRLRGLLDLDGQKLFSDIRNLSQNWTPSFGDYDADFDTHDYNWFRQSTFPWATRQVIRWSDALVNAPFCFFCSSAVPVSSLSIGEPFQTEVNIVQSALFNDILNTTESPALALQAQMTTLMRMAYYDWLPQFSAATESFALFSRPSLAPYRHTGYWVVIVVLAVHSILIAWTTLLFCKRTQYSNLDDAWQAIAQVASSRPVAERLVTVDESSGGMKAALSTIGKTPYRLGEQSSIEAEQRTIALVPTDGSERSSLQKRTTFHGTS